VEIRLFYVSVDHIDKLLTAVYTKLLSSDAQNTTVISTKGTSTEVFGALLEITNPRARLSRSENRSIVFSALGELSWYLASDDSLKFITYYLGRRYADFSDDGVTVNGAYGKRIFGASQPTQWTRVMSLLKKRPGSRNGVIQIFANDDAERSSADIPCTCTLHFAVRNQKLHLHAHMRSNDAWIGMPHDIFAFTMLQEIAALELGCELGSYHHSVASLHLYDDNEFGPSRTLAQAYLDEGIHEEKSMPPMPPNDPWADIRQLLKAESEYRHGNLSYQPETSEPYWSDLSRLFQIYGMLKLDASSDEYRVPIEKIDVFYRALVYDRLDKWSDPDDTAFNLLRNS
jgi:thymidylate synthase